MTNKELLEMYMKGFSDELNGSLLENEIGGDLYLKAYKLGSQHAILGDDVRSFDYLTEEQILKLIKNE